MTDESTKELEDVNAVMMSEPEVPRENLIQTAVNFLRNPKVQGSPLAQKKLFLEKKGLTKEEVQIAVTRSGVSEHAQFTPNGPQGKGPVYQVQTANIQPGWRIRDVTAFVVVVGGIGTALYKLYTAVLKPYWFGGSEKTAEERIIELQEKMVEKLTQVQESLTAIQHSLTLQDERMSQLSIESGARKTEQNFGQLRDSQFINEMKTEVSSIKGLLLNRRQFPPTPSTTPVLPAWQRAKPQEEKQLGTDSQQKSADMDSTLSAASVTLPNGDLKDMASGKLEVADDNQAELSAPSEDSALTTTTTECQAVPREDQTDVKPEAGDGNVNLASSGLTNPANGVLAEVDGSVEAVQ